MTSTVGRAHLTGQRGEGRESRRNELGTSRLGAFLLDELDEAALR